MLRERNSREPSIFLLIILSPGRTELFNTGIGAAAAVLLFLYSDWVVFGYIKLEQLQ